MSISNLNISSYVGKSNGNPISADTWNGVFGSIQTKVNEVITALNASDSTPAATDALYVNGTLTAPVSGVVSLTTGGTYVLSGTLTGKVVVGTSTDNPTDDTHIVLAGVTFKYTGNDNKAIEYAPQAQSLQVTLAKNTVNILVCSNVAAIAEQQGAALFSDNNMILQGNGYLAIQQKGGHGIKASELRISGNPHVYVESNHDGIHGNSKLSIDGGVFYVKGANDAFGTGTTGSIRVFGGEFYAYSIQQKVFDSKVAGQFFADFALHTNSTSENLASGMTRIDPKVFFGSAVQDTTNGGYTTNPSGTVTCYTDEAMTTGALDIIASEGVYTLTTKYAKVQGYIEGKITTSVQSTNIELKNAYVVGNIEYTATKKKLQINVEKDNVGIVVGNITSGSNLAVEVKGGGYCLVTGNVSGDELTFNDSKGVCIVSGDVTGKDIYIGTAATADATKFLQGAFIVRGTLKAINNSKFSKGWIHVLSTGLTGIFCADIIDAAGYADLGGSNKVYYHKAIGMVVGEKTIEDNDYIAV